MTIPGLEQTGSRVLLREVNDETLAAVVRECMEFCASGSAGFDRCAEAEPVYGGAGKV
jgi:hypothetical protein